MLSGCPLRVGAASVGVVDVTIPSSVVGAICPPVMPYMPLLMNIITMFFATVGGVYGLACAYGSEIAVALVGKYHFVGAEALDGCGHGRGASVGGFNPVDIDVAVCEYGTSYGRYAYGLVFEAELFCDFSHKFM